MPGVCPAAVASWVPAGLIATRRWPIRPTSCEKAVLPAPGNTPERSGVAKAWPAATGRPMAPGARSGWRTMGRASPPSASSRSNRPESPRSSWGAAPPSRRSRAASRSPSSTASARPGPWPTKRSAPAPRVLSLSGSGWLSTSAPVAASCTVTSDCGRAAARSLRRCSRRCSRLARSPVALAKASFIARLRSMPGGRAAAVLRWRPGGQVAAMCCPSDETASSKGRSPSRPASATRCRRRVLAVSCTSTHTCASPCSSGGASDQKAAKAPPLPSAARAAPPSAAATPLPRAPPRKSQRR